MIDLDFFWTVSVTFISNYRLVTILIIGSKPENVINYVHNMLNMLNSKASKIVSFYSIALLII